MRLVSQLQSPPHFVHIMYLKRLQRRALCWCVQKEFLLAELRRTWKNRVAELDHCTKVTWWQLGNDNRGRQACTYLFSKGGKYFVVYHTKGLATIMKVSINITSATTQQQWTVEWSDLKPNWLSKAMKQASNLYKATNSNSLKNTGPKAISFALCNFPFFIQVSNVCFFRTCHQLNQ